MLHSSVTKKRQQTTRKKDEQLRRKAESDLKRRTITSNASPMRSVNMSPIATPSKREAMPQKSPANQRLRKKGTVGAVKLNEAQTVREHALVSQAAQLMAAKRTDAVLVVDAEGILVGVVTDKEIAHLVVAGGHDVRAVQVAALLDPEAAPFSVETETSIHDAMCLLLNSRQTHVPVVEKEMDQEDLLLSRDGQEASQSIVGLLDITKCVFDRIEILQEKSTNDQNIVKAMETLQMQGNLDPSFATSFKSSHACPDVLKALDDYNTVPGFPAVTVKTTVREAARCMEANQSTAVLVMSNDSLAGIFTTKDILLRVLAAGLDPNTTSVIRVMTPHPDVIDPASSILDALKTMKAHHYNHLPVVADGTIIGLLDVQQLTMATLDYIINGATNDSTNGSSEKHNWSSIFGGGLADQSFVFDESSRLSYAPSESFYAPSESAATHDEAELPLTQIKLKDTLRNRVLRISACFENTKQLIDTLGDRLGIQDGQWEAPLFYIDDEGDYINLATEEDLYEAIMFSRRLNNRLVIHYGESPVEDVGLPSVEEPILAELPIEPIDPVDYQEHQEEKKDEVIEVEENKPQEKIELPVEEPAVATAVDARPEEMEETKHEPQLKEKKETGTSWTGAILMTTAMIAVGAIILTRNFKDRIVLPW